MRSNEEVISILEALVKLNHIPENAVIAGGCIRDLFIGEPFRDIDVFFHKYD